ncbi:MAG: hypothetical protein EYC69_11035 [Bacteroidetes bacterium]|nr:MAG: hypothetical protein EYC69_11035 [Bacteroidota bacterium]
MKEFATDELLEPNTSLSGTDASVLKILIYFDNFQHPLRADEIAAYSIYGSEGISSIQHTLDQLRANGLINYSNGHYFINGNESWISRRLEGEKNAQRALKKARWFSGIIAGFPFVRGICLSGSISKNYMDANADIDYFVITSPGRMWLSRTMLVLFKKIFLLNSKKYFCVNYFVTEESLSIPNKNIFTATELAFLIPTYGQDHYYNLMSSNNWYRAYYPKLSLRDDTWLINKKRYFFKKLFEKILSGSFGDRIDSYFFRLTLNHWKKKFNYFDEETFDLRLRSRKNESKHHPLGYQEKILSRYKENLYNFESKHSVKLGQ